MTPSRKRESSNISSLLALRPIPACLLDPQGDFLQINNEMKMLMHQNNIDATANLLSLVDSSEAVLLHSHFRSMNNSDSDAMSRYVLDNIYFPRLKCQFRLELQKVSSDVIDNGWIMWLEPLNNAVVESRYDMQMKSAIMDASLDTLITIDINDVIVEYSESGKKAFGWTKNEVLGKRMVDILVPHAYRDAHMKGMQHYKATCEGPLLGKRVEIEALHKDGFTIPIELALVPFDMNGKRYVTAFMRDIRDRKEAEQALLEQKERAEQASLAKSRFLSHMSHELRSPLNALLGTLNVLEQEEQSQSTSYYLGIARSSGGLLLSVINEILDFSKIESGNVQVTPTAVDLRSCLNDSLSVVQPQCGIDVILSGYIHPNLPTKVVCDELKLKQIIVILADNALKFTKSGNVNVVLKLFQSTDKNVKLQLQVTDTGVGIDSEMQQTVFAEFEQVDAMRDTRYGGTGLGLAIARKLVELMEGNIELVSEVGKGTTFNVILPIPALEFEFKKYSQSQPIIAFSQNQAFINVVRDYIACVYDEPEFTEIVSEVELISQVEKATKVHSVLTDNVSDLLVLTQVMEHKQIDKMIICTRLPFPNEHDFNDKCSFLSAPIILNELNDALEGRVTCEETESITDDDQNSVQTLRLLLVEDQAANRIVARALLEKLGHIITDAEDGMCALEELDSCQDYDAILMDMRMPRLNGIETAKRIRSRTDHYAQIPIIALTANAEQSEVQRCYDEGFNAFVTKPFNAQDLSELIKKLIHEYS